MASEVYSKPEPLDLRPNPYVVEKKEEKPPSLPGAHVAGAWRLV